MFLIFAAHSKWIIMNEITTIDRILYDLKPFIEYANDHFFLTVICVIICLIEIVGAILFCYSAIKMK